MHHTHTRFFLSVYISKKLGKLFCREWRNFFTSLVVVFFSESWNNSVFEFEKSVTSFKLEYTQHLVAGMIFFSFKKHIDSIYEPSLSKNLTIIVQQYLHQRFKRCGWKLFYFIIIIYFILNIFLRIEINKFQLILILKEKYYAILYLKCYNLTMY